MYRFGILIISACVLAGCHMFTAWKSIPPPGGCDQCHSVAIDGNWSISYRAAAIPDEQGRQAFQLPESILSFPAQENSPVELKKMEEMACFQCHTSPTPAHRDRKGRFHH